MTERNRDENLARVDVLTDTGTTSEAGQTLPPEARGKVSGQFDFRRFLRDSGYPPARLKEPNLGVTLLKNFPEWDLLNTEIQEMIQDRVLDFIAVEPIPSDEEIIVKIIKEETLAAKKLAGKRILEKYRELPEPISVALMHYLFEIVESNRATPHSEIESTAKQMAELAIMEMKHELIAGVDPQSSSPSLRYARIAQAVIQTRERLIQVANDMDDGRPQQQPDFDGAERDTLLEIVPHHK